MYIFLIARKRFGGSHESGGLELLTRKSIDVQTILELLGMVYSDEEEVTTGSQNTQTE